jgi:uncharacterized protein YuzE
MKLIYDPETDSLYVDLSSKPSAESREVSEGVIADFDAEGRIVGLDIEHASERLDLSVLEAQHLPTGVVRVG